MAQTLRIICILCALATLIVMVIVSDLSSLHLLVIFAIFAMLVNAPYILGWIFAGRLGGQQTGLIILPIGILAAAALGFYGYYDAFFSARRKDAQDALVFIVLPVYQSGGVLLAFLAAKVLARLRG